MTESTNVTEKRKGENSIADYFQPGTKNKTSSSKRKRRQAHLSEKSVSENKERAKREPLAAR